MDSFKSAAWLLMGIIGSAPGILEFHQGILSFTILDCGALGRANLKKLEKITMLPGIADKIRSIGTSGQPVVLFSEPLSNIGISYPWYYFKQGVKIGTSNAAFRLSFVQPQNTVIAPHALGALEGIGNLIESRNTSGTWNAIFSQR